VKRFVLLILVCLVAYGATGLYFVQPDEQVIVRRFGRIDAMPREPGPHFGLPWGLDRIDRLKPREVKQVTLGPLNLAGEAIGTSQSQFLTGDRNLVLIRATVQYTIKDPAQYLFRAGAVDPLVASAGEAAMSIALAGHPVDHVMTLGKRELGIQIAQRLQTFVDAYELGVMVRSVDIGSVDPPPEVAEAFDNVISALRERERQINLARGYADRTQAQSQAGAQRLRDQAQGYRDRRTREAQGEAERFEQLLAQYRQSPALTAQRLYLDAMADTLPKFRTKLIMDSEMEMDLSIIREESP
jgi:membrane protease subunit HflK